MPGYAGPWQREGRLLPRNQKKHVKIFNAGVLDEDGALLAGLHTALDLACRFQIPTVAPFYL